MLDQGPRPATDPVFATRLVDSERFQIIVSDTGMGIPAENLTCIFNHGFNDQEEAAMDSACTIVPATPKEIGGTLVAEKAMARARVPALFWNSPSSPPELHASVTSVDRARS